MSEQEAVRRLVKSGPELWAQCSDPLLLSKHLAAFGEITITRLEPESTVAWEGESVSGTVSFEPAGWGTRVRLTAVPPTGGAVATIEARSPAAPEVADELPPVDVELSPVATSDAALAADEPDAPMLGKAIPIVEPRRFGGLFGALWRRRRALAAAPIEPALAPRPALAPEPEMAVEPEAAAAAEPEATTPTVTDSLDVVAELEAALDSLGAAHHRPYSRS